MKKLLLNKKQIGTICFSKFFKFCAVAFVAIFCGLFCSGDSAALIIDVPIIDDDDIPELPYCYRYSVTYSCGIGGGTAPENWDTTYCGSEEVTTALNSCTPPSGKVFGYWDCNGINVNAGDAFMVNANTTCTAQYGSPLTITYSCGSGGGTAPTDSYNYISGATVTTASSTCTPPSGKAFAYWNCGGANVNMGDTFTMPNDDVTCTAQYVNADYTVTYSCGAGSGTPPASIGVANGVLFVPVDNVCTPPNGKMFSGWLVGGTNTIVYPNIPFTWNYSENKTLTAQYEDLKFSITTSATNELQFMLSAQGTFYVDCGTGGILSSTNSTANAMISGGTINKTDTTNYIFKCSYSNSAVRTIRFGGTATNYTTSAVTGTISFHVNWENTYAEMIASVSGDLSTMFPYISGNASDGAQPRFYYTFSGAVNLQSIPDTLFSGYTTASTYMFDNTFSGCTGLTSIPHDLFASFLVGAEQMFVGAFSGCTGLTSIPHDLFASITSCPECTFQRTFSGCTGLTSIPHDLFSNFTTGFMQMFRETFSGCTGLTSIPHDLFASITTGGSYMFFETFKNCTGITSIPHDLFSNFTTGAGSMFYGVFSGCTGLTSIPHDLFANVTTGADWMFEGAFSGCINLTGYIPPILFDGLIKNNVSARSFYGTFSNTGMDTSCPSGTEQYAADYTSAWGGKVSCTPTNALSVTYSCGTGTGNAPASTTATYNASFTPAASTCTAPTGYGFDGWLVSGDGSIKPAGTAFTWIYVNDKTFTAQWTPNVINLTFDNVASPASCTFGSTFIPPTPEPRPGYVFTGWKVKTVTP